MSGYKRATVTISEEEYRRLHQADMKRRFRSRSKKKKTKDSPQLEGLHDALQQLENRHQQLEQAFSHLDQDVSQSDAAMMQEILGQNALSYENLAAFMEASTSESNDSLALLSQQFTEEMERQREEYHHNLQALLQQLDADEQRDQIKTETARQWLNRCVLFADFIQKEFDHERFLPNSLTKILTSLDYAQSNLAQGFQEASLQTSQQAFLQLSELRLELEQRTLEWQAEYETAYGGLTQFIAELELNSSVNAFGLEGEELADQVDLTFWTDGRYQQLLSKSRELLGLLSQDRQLISTEELRRTHTELLPVIAERFESLIYEARLKALNSQLRMNIAERALQALENHGFVLNESGYVNEDMRASFTAQLGNNDGSQVTIQVLPAEKPSEQLSNELIVITKQPYIKSQQEVYLQWQELCRSLNQDDLHVSRPEVRDTPSLTTSGSVEQAPLPGQPLLRSER